MIKKPICGSKGGSHTPVESPNTLKSVALARIVDLVSEGEIVGLVDGMKSIYLDETPLQNSDGTMNFKNVLVEHRYGTQAQSPIAGFAQVENEVGVSVELTQSTPWTHAITNLSLDAFRVRLSVPALTTTNTKNGDITGGNVAYAIDLAVDGGPYVEVISSAFRGKCTTKYERIHRIQLPAQTAGSTGWQVRVRRITANSTLASVTDKTYIESYTEVIDEKLRYPNSALVAMTVDSSQFQSIPTRAYDLKGRIIRVPANYNPTTREYATTGPGTSGGIWDGTFQLAWTDNPAWCFYDLITHPRYGLGHLITDAQVNKFKLYEIAQYCDELVPDGLGGEEPRFTCNLYLQTRADAYKVISDMATIFRGISYWANGEIHAVADKPEDPVHTYSPANVVGGTFAYQGTARKTRATVALVTWSDTNDFGRQQVEYVDDAEGIERYGVQQVEVTAIGCTSRGQAQRVGRYILLTGRVETDTVSFNVGIDGTIVAPGKIIRIADPLRANRRMGGRIAAAAGDGGMVPDHTITLDAAPALTINAGDTLTVVSPTTGLTETRSIIAVSLDNKEVTVSPGFTELPLVGSSWSIDAATLETQRYRVVSVTEAENNQFTITAVRHNESKFEAVDEGTAIVEPPTSDYPAVYQVAPTSVIVDTHEYAVASVTTVRGFVSWLKAEGATLYEVEYIRNDGDWTKLGMTSGLTFDLPDDVSGNYTARVRAYNAIGIKSSWAMSDETLVIDPVQVPGYYVQPLEIVAGVVTVDCSLSEHFSLDLTEDATLEFINVPFSERVVMIDLYQHGAGSDYDLTLPGIVTYASGVPYVTSKITDAEDALGFYTNSKGIAWTMRYSKNVNFLIGGPTTGLLTATYSPNPAYGYAAANPSVTVTVTPSGGTAPYTYSWARGAGGAGDWGGSSGDTGGANFTFSSSTVANPTISRTGTADGLVAQNWICTVTDSASLTTNVIVEVGLEDDGVGGGGPGGWTCPSVCAWVVMVDSEPVRAGDIRVGDRVIAVNPDTLEEFAVQVTHSTTAQQPAVRVVTSDGVALTCSRTAPLPVLEGGHVNAADVLGRITLVCVNGQYLWRLVVAVEDVGDIAVQHITCDNQFFLVGDTINHYMAHHNIKNEPND